MPIFGLEIGGQIIILQGLSTYTGIASAWYFAKPVLRNQAITASKNTLSEVDADQADVRALFNRASKALAAREIKNDPLNRRDNKIAIVFLVVSLALFTAALVLQIVNEPSFHHPAPADSAVNFPAATVT